MAIIQPDSPKLESPFSDHPLFADLDDASQAALSRAARKRRFGKGEIVFHEGDEAKGIYLVESGWLKAVKLSSEGREQILDTLGPGYLVNLQNIFTGSPMVVSLEALEDCQLWFIPSEAISQAIENQPKLAIAIIRLLAERMEYLAAKVEDLSLRSVDARLAKYLLEHQIGGKVERQKWATQSELAAQIGTVLDVLNRSLKKFEDQKLIEMGRREIRLIEKVRLEEIAHS